METISIELPLEKLQQGVKIIIRVGEPRELKLDTAIKQLENLLRQNVYVYAEDVFDLMAKMGFGRQLVYEAGRRVKAKKAVDFTAGVKRWYWFLPTTPKISPLDSSSVSNPSISYLEASRK